MPDKIYAYDNFNVNVNGDSFKQLVFAIWVGVLVAIAVALVIRYFTGGLVRRLKNAGASTEASAKTLDELDVRGFMRFVAPLFMKDSSSLMRYVQIASPDEATVTYSGFGKFWQKNVLGRSFSLRRARFYLPEEHRITAETRFSVEEHPWRGFIIAAAILTAGAVFTAWALPELLLMLDNFISMNS